MTSAAPPERAASAAKRSRILAEKLARDERRLVACGPDGGREAELLEDRPHDVRGLR